MSEANEWYEVIEHKNYLYVIRERLDEIDPRYYTKFTNMYLIIGDKKALLIDTGSGLFPLKPIVQNIIRNKQLIVLNTHSHFDHRGGNEEFDEVYIHEKELKNASMVFDVSILKDSPKSIVKLLNNKDFKYQPAKVLHAINDGDIIDLGGITIKVIHTPGHSIGSISLLSNKNELFTGDTAHYGAMYLPKRKYFPIILSSLEKLLTLTEKEENLEIYPSHERFAVGKMLLKSLKTGIMNIENIWETKEKDKFLHSWILDDGNFKYII